MTIVIRRYDFSAAHVLRRSDWDEDRNQSVYGKCANPAGHGHNYEVFVSVRGDPDPDTGRVVSWERMDNIIRERVIEPLDHTFLNREIPEFLRTVPTAENIARYIWDALKGELAPAQLHRIRLVETRNNSVEYYEDSNA